VSPSRAVRRAAATPDRLLANNRAWSRRMTRREPGFFRRLAGVQSPRYLWIGCSDSRVPANEIVGLLPGEMFVHRNVANLVVHTDLNCLSVIHYAVDVLNVSHIIVCGHYGCGGVRAVAAGRSSGLIDNWLRHLADVRDAHAARLAALRGERARLRALSELNVEQQVRHVAETSVVRDAWAAGRRLSVHGWIYGLEDGLLRDLLPAPVRSVDDLRRVGSAPR
jgi:carbonic anhydrase